MKTKDTGVATLEAISEAGAFNEWMFNTIRPYIKGRTLEIGSGIGNISSMFVQNHMPLYLSDITETYRSRLREKFAGVDAVKGVFSIDLVDKNFDTAHAAIAGTFDTVFALNVIEHIEDDHLAVENCYKLLAPGGRLIVLVPAWASLYNRLDKGLEHFRRYTPITLRKPLSGYFNVMEMKYFNLAGIFGWWLTGVVLRKPIMEEGQVKFYNRLVPLFRLADRLTFHKLGLSLIAVADKK